VAERREGGELVERTDFNLQDLPLRVFRGDGSKVREMGYDTRGRPTTMQNGTGEALSMTYSNGYMNSVTLPPYNGNADVLTDVRFAGGKLANNAPWPRGVEVPYYLDSFEVGLLSRGSPVTFGATNGGCYDTGAPTTVAASVTFETAAYGPSISNGNLRDKITLEANGRNLGRNVSAILAFTFNADPGGLRHPDVPCNRIHLDFRRSWD